MKDFFMVMFVLSLAFVGIMVYTVIIERFKDEAGLRSIDKLYETRQ